MLKIIMLLIGSILIVLWGIAHMVPVRSIVNGFGNISVQNRRIITMEWIISGAGMIFAGILALLITVFGNITTIESMIVYWSSSGILITFAIITLLTGARTGIVPIKVCPAVNVIAAIAILTGAML
jgi:hypothetical protein